ncbi:LysR family transcriptional regulator [Roseovarius sp. SCSIO 43702]|uniref:LysR substrate-binding domain-containing protein n=1 Tax=Roseovarius sp. SCSIO 43702 TaxID=2823043 RepID=UPI001C72C18B|nr:LysR substrate-binding domain-containing protein [Roseovarius sp. SCSIO 43702]QYX55700.1 LysR family transcriptional regulator [Roseovarius sp. SCSIO 43702]
MMKIGDTWVSLNALQSFEAAARHQHMARAAEELGVTQSAVSHQVRALETALALPLFDRRGRRIILNPSGERLLRAIQSGFDEIATTALSLTADAFSGTLSIAVPVSLTVEWLGPKLAEFLKRFPNLSLRCSYTERTMTVLPSEIDLAIVFAAHSFPGHRVTPFIRTEIFPVCAPDLARDALPLDPAILRRATIIHEDDGALWSRWFASRGLEQVRPARDIHAGSYHDAVALAREGVGFALSDWFLGGRALGSGGLVQAFGPDVMDYHGYYIITRGAQEPDSAASALAAWLTRAAAQETLATKG